MKILIRDERRKAWMERCLADQGQVDVVDNISPVLYDNDDSYQHVFIHLGDLFTDVNELRIPGESPDNSVFRAVQFLEERLAMKSRLEAVWLYSGVAIRAEGRSPLQIVRYGVAYEEAKVRSRFIRLLEHLDPKFARDARLDVLRALVVLCQGYLAIQWDSDEGKLFSDFPCDAQDLRKAVVTMGLLVSQEEVLNKQLWGSAKSDSRIREELRHKAGSSQWWTIFGRMKLISECRDEWGSGDESGWAHVAALVNAIIGTSKFVEPDVVAIAYLALRERLEGS